MARTLGGLAEGNASGVRLLALVFRAELQIDFRPTPSRRHHRYYLAMSRGNERAGKFFRDGPNLPKYPLALIHPLGPIFRHLPLSLRRHLLYVQAYGRWGNFRTPRLFSEKMQWRILNDRRPLISWTCDKLASKEYASKTADAAGVALRIPATYWAGTDIEALKVAAQSFPTRWVLKPNHSCGRLRIVDSSVGPVDWQDLAKVVGAWVARDEEELVHGHWAYGEARHLLIAEEYVAHDTATLPDYKLIGFNGRVQSIITSADALDLEEAPKVFDRNFELQLIAASSANDQQLLAIDQLTAADRKSLITIAELLIAPFEQMRVDLFVAGGEVWFGEFSTYHSSGLRSPFGRRMTGESDAARGTLWKIPDLAAVDTREGEWRKLLD